MNLGVLAPHNSKVLSRTQDRIVELPAGVKYATAGIHSLTPSLVCIVGKTYGPLEEARILCLARGAKDHIAPSHISKMVPPTVHSGP